LITVTLYARRHNEACEVARADLESLQPELPHRLVEIFVEDDKDLYRAYLDKVPVVEAGPYHKEAPFSRADLLVTLRAASDRKESLEKLGDADYRDRVRRGQTVSRGDRVSYWLSRNYIWLIALLLFLYVGLPFLAPVLMRAHKPRAANIIYTAYSPLCHQLAFRSFFLFGEQVYYPRQAAGIAGVRSFGQATGIDENDLLAARKYRGDQSVGYKVAFCERDVAIYTGMFIFVLVFGATGRRLKPFPWFWWVLIGILPIAFDGFSQLFSQSGLPGLAQILPYRESTPSLRVLTGFLFGFTTAWFGVPYIEESMRETRRVLSRKFAAVSGAEDVSPVRSRG
jgi:uncharacterized membrane protein